jgi:hypothetical protein
MKGKELHFYANYVEVHEEDHELYFEAPLKRYSDAPPDCLTVRLDSEAWKALVEYIKMFG